MFLGKTNLKFDFLQIIFHECCILHPSSYNMIIQLFYLKFTYFNVNGFGKSYKELFASFQQIYSGARRTPSSIKNCALLAFSLISEQNIVLFVF